MLCFFLQFLKPRMGDIIVENKIRSNTTHPISTTRTEGLRGADWGEFT